jgi:hypothetical protein
LASAAGDLVARYIVDPELSRKRSAVVGATLHMQLSANVEICCAGEEVT